MLNLLKLKSDINKIENEKDNLVILNNNINKQNNVKHFPPAIKEWNNSIYAYNKNTLNTIPIINKTVVKLIKNYFNLYNSNLESKLRRYKLRIRKRRFSTHKIYVSNGEFKHTHNKVIINLYIYNRQKYNYITRILNNNGKKRRIINNKRKRRINLLSLKRKRSNLKKLTINNRKWAKLNSKDLKKTMIRKSKTNLIRLNKETWTEKLFLKKLLKIRKSAQVFLKKSNNKRSHLIRNLKWDSKFKKLEIFYYKKFIKKSLKREMKNLYYRRLLLFNKFKFKYTYIQSLTNLIKNIYNKNVEFNIINLKYFYLNSDIFTDFVINRITKKRKKLLKILKRSIRKVKIANIKWIGKKEDKIYNKRISLINRLNKDNMLLDFSQNNNLNYINNLLNKNFLNNMITSKKSLEKLVLNTVKYKTITGVRVEATGRLSKRHTASRSLYKVKYKGSLKNKDSSFKKLSSVMLRGNIRSNLQYTKRNSTVNIGSFGIKGWISNN